MKKIIGSIIAGSVVLATGTGFVLTRSDEPEVIPVANVITEEVPVVEPEVEAPVVEETTEPVVEEVAPVEVAEEVVEPEPVVSVRDQNIAVMTAAATAHGYNADNINCLVAIGDDRGDWSNTSNTLGVKTSQVVAYNEGADIQSQYAYAFFLIDSRAASPCNAQILFATTIGQW